MATKAKKLPSGMWRARAQLVGMDGSRHYKSFTAETRKEAEFLATQYSFLQKEITRTRTTVGEAIAGYIDLKEKVLSPSTVVGYRQIQRRAFPSIANIRLDTLTNRVIQSAINLYTVNHAPKTVRNATALLMASLAEFAPEKQFRVALPSPQKPSVAVPTQSEVKSILEATNGTPMHIAYLLCALLGLRRSEVSAVEWADVNFNAKTITINKAVVISPKKTTAPEAPWVTKAPKSYAGTRTLTVPTVIMDELERLRPTATDPRIVPFKPDAVYRHFKHLRTSLGFSFRLHDLRHYCASVMLALNVPDKYAMERMGHATPNMLKTVYQHTFAEHQKNISDRINAFYEKM